jgi:hypothetical protein
MPAQQVCQFKANKNANIFSHINFGKPRKVPEYTLRKAAICGDILMAISSLRFQRTPEMLIKSFSGTKSV